MHSQPLQISSQPVIDDDENARQTRQLGFGECCPCPGPGQGFATQESSMSRARDIEVCRPRSSDSEGASSIFFPTSTRSDGNFVRPVDKKEDLKPLLHPEVDLASSVLQTLSEATDEEYRDALARDAARSMAKAAEESMFGDTIPEASNGNLVTIIVNPKHAESLDDVIPQETNVQESHCINPPLESVNTNLEQMRVTQNPPSLLGEIFGPPKLSKPAGLLHQNLLDMGNSASNIQDTVVHVDNDQVTNKIILGLRKYAPLMKFDTNIENKSTNMKSNLDVNTSVKKIPEFKLPSMKNKLKDLIANRTALERKVKTNSLPLIPKMRLNKTLFTVKGEDEKGLSLSQNNIHEQAKKSFIQTKSHLENILQSTRPVGLKTLLKLKDVEFVPLKDMVPKVADRPTLTRPKLTWPDIFKKRDTLTSTDKVRDPINVARSKEIIEKVPTFSQDKVLDAEVSPTNVFEQINDDNCNNDVFKTTEIGDEENEAKTTSTEIIDTESNPSEIEEIVSDASNNFANSQSSEVPDNTDGCNIKTLQITETNLPQSMESFLENEAQGNNEDELDFETSEEITALDTIADDDSDSELVSNDENCVSNPNEADSITDTSNNTNDVLKPNDTFIKNVEDSLGNENIVTEEDCSQELPISDNSKTIRFTGNDFGNSQLNEVPDNTDECNIKTLSVSETNLPQPMENSFENEAQGNNEDELNFETSKEITPLDIKAEVDSESEFVSHGEDCVSNTNDADSITDSSNNTNDILKPNDIVLENVEDSLENENTITEEDCSQELRVSDNSKTLETNPTQLIKPLTLDETVSTIKEKIAKHIKNLKNPKNNSKISKNFDSPILKNKTSNNFAGKEPSPITDDKLGSDCKNEETIHVTSIKPVICNDDSNIEKEPDGNKVSMHDLQKISDEMLQEEQERASKTLKCNVPTQKVTDPKEPIEVNSAENEKINVDPKNVVNIVDENDNDVKNTCQSNLKLSRQLFEPESDANVEASEVVVNRTPQSNDIFTSPLLLNKVLQPNENAFSLNIPLPDIQDFKLVPLPTLDEIKLSLTNLFDTPAREVEEHSASEAASMIDRPQILAPIMSTDASARHFQSMLPALRLEDVDLDILPLKPQLNIFPEMPKLDLYTFRSKLPLPNDLRIKPLKLQSPFDEKGGLLSGTLSLGQNNPWEMIPGLDDFGTRMKANTQKIAKMLRKPDILRLKSSRGIGDLSDAKNNLRNMQHSLESKIRGATTKPVNLQSNDLLEAISRNHEDVNDKLRALHIDFNDRLETMRNNIFEKSLFGSGESRSTKSFSTFSNKNKDKKKPLKASQPESLSSRRQSKKTLKPQRLSHGLQNKFQMPTAASVPVPRTIEVPELKATLTKSPGLGIQRAPGINPSLQNTGVSQPRESSITLLKQASKLPISNTRLGKTMNPFKDDKIKVLFSTTSRPSLSTKLQSRKLSTTPSLSLTSNLGKNTGRLGQRLEHNGSPSEMKHSIISAPISSQLDRNDLENYGLESGNRQTTWKLGGRKNVEHPKVSKNLQSWPKVSESAFLSKVKEAVKARISNVNSPVTFKRADGHSVTDMVRSASTNTDVIEGQALKENVSYKCTMVCSKE